MPANSSPFKPSAPPAIKLLVAPMHSQHLDQVAAIERLCFRQPWSRVLFQAELQNPQALPLVALSLPSQRVVGHLILWLVLDEVEVQNLAVHPAFQRLGVGRHLLCRGLSEAMDRGARRASLEVRQTNLAAQRLYHSLGFTLAGRRPRYYQAENEDALIMCAEMCPAL